MVRSKPKARKEHICHHCGLTIEKGEVYHKSVYFPGEYDYDELSEFKTHRLCYEMSGNYVERAQLGWEDGYDWDEVRECFWERNGILKWMKSWWDYRHSKRRYLRLCNMYDENPTEEHKRIKENCKRHMASAAKNYKPAQFQFDDEVS